MKLTPETDSAVSFCYVQPNTILMGMNNEDRSPGGEDHVPRAIPLYPAPLPVGEPQAKTNEITKSPGQTSRLQVRPI